MLRGTVVAISRERKVGYIASPERLNDISFRISDLETSALPWNERLVGRDVSFEVITVDRCERAVSVKLNVGTCCDHRPIPQPFALNGLVFG